MKDDKNSSPNILRGINRKKVCDIQTPTSFYLYLTDKKISKKNPNTVG